MRSERELAAAVAAVSVSGALWFWGTGLEPRGWMVFFAPAPVLAFAALTRRAAWAGVVAFLAYAAGAMNMWRPARDVFDVPFVAAATLLIVPAVAFAGAVLLARTCLRRRSIVMGLFALPAAWVTYEYISSLFSPHGTLLNLAYSQTDCLPLLQLSALTGLWGITFVVLLVPSTVVLVALRRDRRATLAGAAALASVILVMALGALRWAAEPSGPRVTIGLAATDAPPLFPEEPETTRRAAATYATVIGDLARAGARIIVLPELVLRLAKGADGIEEAEPIRLAAAAHRVTVVIGVLVQDEPLDRNRALVFSPDGRLLASYDKHHLVPVWETHHRPGDSLAVLDEGETPWGVAICKDLDFPSPSRDYGAREIGLLAVPAWDKVIDGRLHGRMAVVRGVEYGFVVARAAKQGLLTVSDERGRIVAEKRSDAAEVATLVASVPLPRGATPYRLAGDWFAWLAVLGVGGILAGLVRGRHARPTD